MNNTDLDPTHRVALMGFASFEAQALESYIQLAGSRTPAYTLASSVEGAHFVIANGDRLGVIDVLLTAQRIGDTLMVGGHARHGSAAWLERPVDPLHLFRALDTAVRRRALTASAARVTARDVTHAELHEVWNADAEARLLPQNSPFAWRRTPAAAKPSSSGLVARNTNGAALASATAHDALIQRPHGQLRVVPTRVPPGPGEPLLALVVGAQDSGAMAIAMALQAHGISSEWALESRRAFAALQDQVFDLIVIDVDLGSQSDLDGLSLAQSMKRQPRPYGEACPPIFVTSQQPSPLEHTQAMVAGADAYLDKPLSPEALSAALEAAALRTVTVFAPQAESRSA